MLTNVSNHILKGYRGQLDYNEVFVKVKDIERRGRYKSNLDSRIESKFIINIKQR